MVEAAIIILVVGLLIAFWFGTRKNYRSKVKNEYDKFRDKANEKTIEVEPEPVEEYINYDSNTSTSLESIFVSLVGLVLCASIFIPIFGMLSDEILNDSSMNVSLSSSDYSALVNTLGLIEIILPMGFVMIAIVLLAPLMSSGGEKTQKSKPNKKYKTKMNKKTLNKKVKKQ